MTAKKGFYTKMTETEAAYIAGLFDGEGCVSYKQYMRKRKHNPKALSNVANKIRDSYD
jgi:intein/homing endonuclease